MAELMRKCEKCGALDMSKSWSSPDAASKDGAFDGAWTCSSCAWTEFDLVEGEAEAEKAGASTS